MKGTVERAPANEGIALVLLAIVAAPLMLLIGYGGDVPASTGCWEPRTDPEVVARYRAGAGGVVAAAEVLALAAYAVAVRRCARLKSRVVEVSLALSAAGAGAIGGTWVVAEAGARIALGALGGVAVAALVWLALRAIARRPPTLVAATLALALAVPLALAGWILAFVAYAAPPIVLIPAATIFGAIVVAAIVRRTWPAAALAASYAAVVLIPLGAVVIFSRGHGALWC